MRRSLLRIHVVGALVLTLFGLPAPLLAAEKDDSDRDWHGAWTEQKSLFVWPANFTENQRAIVKDLKFGDAIPDKESVRSQFPESYASDYKRLAEELQPTQFRGDWQKTLRHVGRWDRRPSAEEIWLALEDLWVQREILKQIHQINLDAARFQLVSPADGGKDNPTRRVFRNRVWQIELALAEVGNARTFEAKLTNISSRRQTIGVGNVMKLMVWTSEDAKSPFVFEIEAAAVDAGATMTVKPLERNILPREWKATGIYRVEQKLDLQTVPIKRIEHLVLGKQGERDYQKAQLRMAPFSQKEAAQEGGAPPNAKTPNGLERLRYSEVTEQVRRLPFGVAVVADQEYLTEIHRALASSRLRCLTTQSHWTRFHAAANIDTAPGPMGPIGPPMGPTGPAKMREAISGANLVELSVYGVLSLYEPYPADRLTPKASGDRDTRQSWETIHEFINSCLPVPGPKGNLNDKLERFWQTPEGLRATEKYNARLRQGIDPKGALLDDDLRQHLPTIDVEAVHCRYAAELDEFFRKAARYGKDYVGPAESLFYGMDKTERDPLVGDTPEFPKGAAWVVEVRGTTWFNPREVATREFIRLTLLDNLRQLGKGENRPFAIKDRISHAFVYNTWRDDEPRPDTFHFIYASLIDQLVATDDAVPKGPNVYQRMVAPNDVAPPRGKAPAKAKPRYEFVVIFVWKEPPPGRAADKPDAPKPLAPFFEPIAQIDKRRVNPGVLPVSETQIDFVGAKLLAYDIVDAADGKALIGVIKVDPAKEEKNKKAPNLKDLQKRLLDLKRLMPKSGPLPPVPMGMLGAPPVPMGMLGTRPDLGLPPPAGPPGIAPMETGQRFGVEYVPLDPDKLEGKRLAWTIYPQRMVIVQASFPYKAQVEEIQKALRLEKIADVFSTDGAAPRFRGFVVERQVLFADGKVDVPWKWLDVESNYRATIHPRKFGDRDDDPKLQAVMLHWEHELAIPLPMLLSGKYPELRMKSILEAIVKIWDRRGETGKLKPDELPDSVLVRLIDNDIMPGRRYQYRIKVRMQNPNWFGKPVDKAKYELVARKADADVELIEGPFVEVKEVVGVPAETFMYALDPPPIDPQDRRNSIILRPGQALLQIHRWLPSAAIGSFREPVGDWIVADIVVCRGRYVGGQQLVKLPIWDSAFNRYTLRDSMAEKGPGPKETRQGVMMDPTKPGSTYGVVEIEGGAQEYQTATRRLNEECAAEVLVIDERGCLQVFASRIDRANPDRRRREVDWLRWVERTEKDMAPARPKDKFD